jgi:putative addiction module killer protein
MIEVRQTEEFETWFEGLADHVVRKRIGQRIARLQVGLFGDTKSVGGKVSELRVDQGPGYRVYYTKVGNTVVILLCGGNKATQQRDIDKAKELAASVG